MSGNTITNHRGYRATIVQYLPHLCNLDGKALPGRRRQRRRDVRKSSPFKVSDDEKEDRDEEKPKFPYVVVWSSSIKRITFSRFNLCHS